MSCRGIWWLAVVLPDDSINLECFSEQFLYWFHGLEKRHILENG